MFQPPWTDIGSLQQRVDQLDSQMHRKADSYDVSSLRGDVGRLQDSLREISALVDGLRSELLAAQERIAELTSQLGSKADAPPTEDRNG